MKEVYEVMAFIECGEIAVHITGIKAKKQAFDRARKIKSTNKYETVYVQLINEEEILDDWLI